MWFARLHLALVCIGWPIVVEAQDAPATGHTVTAPGGVAVGRDVKNSPITINFGLTQEQFEETLRRVLKGETGNIPIRPSRGAIACYSHSEVGSSYSVGQDIYVVGIVSDLVGRYIGRIFQPEGYEGKDISAEQTFKDLCNARFPSCKNGCWAGGDTGGFFGYK
jgi:hypothetical protein